MPDVTPTTSAATTSTPTAPVAAAAGAAPIPSDTTQAKLGETATASASTGTEAEKQGAPAADADAAKDTKPPDGQAEADKSKEAEKDTAAAKDAPLELKLPEGFVVDEAVMGKFQALAKEAGLQDEAAQKLVDLHVEMQQAFVASVEAEQARTVAEWQQQTLSDPAYGAKPYEHIRAVAKRAMDRYGSPELAALLDSTGMGSHPALVKFVHGVGQSMREDSVAGRSGSAPAPNTEEAHHRAMYPSMFPPQG